MDTKSALHLQNRPVPIIEEANEATFDNEKALVPPYASVQDSSILGSVQQQTDASPINGASDSVDAVIEALKGEDLNKEMNFRDLHRRGNAMLDSGQHQSENFFPADGSGSLSRQHLHASHGQSNSYEIGKHQKSSSSLAPRKVKRSKRGNSNVQPPVSVLPLKPGHNAVFASYTKTKKYPSVSRQVPQGQKTA